MKHDTELSKMLAVTAELTGTDLSSAAAEIMARELATYDRDQVLTALAKCRRELKGRLTMAAVIERLDDGRPGAEEAWAMIPKSEDESTVWTDEAAQAFGVAVHMLDAGDKVAARMAFKETYLRLVAQARDARRPVEWQVSLGHDPRARDGVLVQAVAQGRMTFERAQSYSPMLPAPRADVLAIAGGAVQRLTQ
jgi:hypothetical protein